MLWYIIYKLEQVVDDVLSQCSIQKNSLIKYNENNGIIPMRTHVDFTHPKLFVQRKLILTNYVVETTHSWQLKKFEPNGCAITSFMGPQFFIKKWWNIIEHSWRSDAIYICVKGFKSLFTYEIIWLWMLVLHQCLHVVFPFHFTLVKKMILVMIKEKPWIYICHLIFASTTTMVTSFDLWMSKGVMHTFALGINYLMNFGPLCMTQQNFPWLDNDKIYFKIFI